MRNVDDNRAAEVPQPEDGTDGLYTSTGARRSRRKQRAMIGAAGLVAILGAGAVAISQVRDDDATTTVADAGVLAPLATATPTHSQASTPSPEPSASTGATSAPAAKRRASPSAPAPTGTGEAPKTPEERVRAARAAAAKDGVKVMRPLPEPTAAVAEAEVTVKETGSVRSDKGTLRLVSARKDLTGLRELGWVAEKGEPVGDALCSSTIRLSNDSQPKKRPTLLICWHTSATKSVYTVAVNVKHPPSKQDSAAAIAKEWSRLG